MQTLYAGQGKPIFVKKCLDGSQTRTLTVSRQSDEKCAMTILKETQYFNGKEDVDHGDTGFNFVDEPSGFKLTLNYISISNVVRDVDCFNEPQCEKK